MTRTLDQILDEVAAIMAPPDKMAAITFNSLRSVVHRKIRLQPPSTEERQKVRLLVCSYFQQVLAEIQRVKDSTSTGADFYRDARDRRLQVAFAEERAYRRLMELCDEVLPP
jgi:hypothetical protein